MRGRIGKREEGEEGREKGERRVEEWERMGREKRDGKGRGKSEESEERKLEGEGEGLWEGAMGNGIRETK